MYQRFHAPRRFIHSQYSSQCTRGLKAFCSSSLIIDRLPESYNGLLFPASLVTSSSKASGDVKRNLVITRTTFWLETMPWDNQSNELQWMGMVNYLLTGIHNEEHFKNIMQGWLLPFWKVAVYATTTASKTLENLASLISQSCPNIAEQMLQITRSQLF